MRRGVWWGTWPLLVGAAGLFLLAFGAGALRSEQEEREWQFRLKVLEWTKEHDRAVQEWQDEQDLPRRRRPPAPADDALKALMATKPNPDTVRDERDPAAVLAGRAAFYAGLVLLLAAGVILFRSAPQHNREDWGERGASAT
jgi:hypothetical protein